MMDHFQSENELIGFRNNEPVTRKRTLELSVEGKHVVLTGNTFKDKIIILKNNKNVRIPVKLCTMVPENVRKAVLDQLPKIKVSIKDKKHVEVNSYLNTNRSDNENNLKCGTSHELVVVKQEPEEVVIKNENSEEKNKKTINNQRKINQSMDKVEKIDHRIAKKMSGKKKVLRRSTTNSQKTLQNILRYLKNQKVKSRRNITASKMKRSISCQTEAFTSEISCQTEKVRDEYMSMDILSLFENTEKDSILGSPFDLMSFTEYPGNSPSPGVQFPLNSQINQNGGKCYGNMIEGNMDVRKMRFYESLKNCDCSDAAGHIPLHLAVLHNNRVEVHNQCLLLKARKFSVDIPNNQGMTPLHLAVLNESEIDIIKILLANGGDPLMKDGEGNTSLHIAIQSTNGETTEDEQILTTLLNHLKKTKENVDVFNYEGFTPLMLCVIEDKYKMALNCITAGADPNTKDQKSGRTSLFHAVENNNLQMVKLFMRTGANTKIKNFFGTSTHEATFELESINPEIKSLIIGKELNINRAKVAVAKKKKKVHQAKSPELPTFKNKFKTVRILKFIDKNIRK